MNHSLLLMAAQDPTGALTQTDHPMWPYWVAIATLASAVATLFGLLMKSNGDFQAKLLAVQAEHRKFEDERSVRIAAEHERKDEKLANLANTSATMLERVALTMEEMRREAREHRNGD